MKAAFVYNDAMSRHVLRDDHPLRPHRLRLTYELLQAYEAFQHPDALLVDPREATEEELELVHSTDYVKAVETISRGDKGVDPARYNFSEHGDNPPFPGMYEASALSTGGSLVAAKLVLEGTVPIAFNASGGLHHAARNHASGFCIFNDPAVAIAWLVQKGLRVAYVDIDAHHGDGVQNAFYDSDTVLTISFHESGRWLFPGTGDTSEAGVATGKGYSVNLPLYPYTSDEVYLQSFDQVVPPLLSAFRPDVLVLQLGVDAYQHDPLAHLQLSTIGYEAVVRQLLTVCPKTICLGGGGYDLAAVARVWALEYGLMLGTEWPDSIPEGYRQQYGVERLRDPGPPAVDAESAEQGRLFAAAGVRTIKETIFPAHGL